MPTIFYKTFPAAAPMPSPVELDMPFSFEASSAATGLQKSESSSAGSPTSVIGRAMQPGHYRNDSFQGFALQPRSPQYEQRCNTDGKRVPVQSSFSSSTSTSTSTTGSKVEYPSEQSFGQRKPLVTNDCGRDGTTSTIYRSIEKTTYDTVDDEDTDTGNEWLCPISTKARRVNCKLQDTIRPITSKIRMGFQRIDRKDPISLASADLTLAHIAPCTKAMEAVIKSTLYKPYGAGYTHATGSIEARTAIALHHSSPYYRLRPDHVIVTNGCSGALDLILETVLEEGTTLLVPCPGFPLYQELAEKYGANVVQYRLDPNKRWECDLQHLEQIMTSHLTIRNFRAIVLNNPSSPTGSVFSERHLEEILSFAEFHRLLIITDEVYGSLTFGTNRFHPMAQVAARRGRNVPVITASGLSKQFLVPGWRVGWLTFQDNTKGSLRQVEEGANRLIQSQHGVNQPAQSAIAPLLSESTPGLAAWREKFRSTLERQGLSFCSNLDRISCLEVAPPQGAMYAIVHIRLEQLNSTIQSDVDFASHLVEEENVFVLPGSTFGMPGTFRIAYSAPERTLHVAAIRISNFCSRHARSPCNVSFGDMMATNFQS